MEAAAKNSLYGPQGWTLYAHVHDIVSAQPELIFSDPTFRRFHDINAHTVRALCDVLPAPNADDRQNSAPTLGQLCSACLRHPFNVTLSGYIIAPPRHDERVTVDALTVNNVPTPKDITIPPVGEEPMHTQRLRIWQYLAEYLGLESEEEYIPDELRCLAHSSEGEYSSWWLWWD